MTIAEAHEYFDLLTDKTGSPYLSSDEKDILITQACIEYVKELFPTNEGGIVNVELDQNVYTNIRTLVYSFNIAYTRNIPVATIQTSLNNVSGSTEPWMYMLRLTMTYSGVTYPMKYVKQNNFYTFQNNSFKAASLTEPQFMFDAQFFRTLPDYGSPTGTPLGFLAVKQPKAVDLGTNTTIELPAHTHKTIVEKVVF